MRALRLALLALPAVLSCSGSTTKPGTDDSAPSGTPVIRVAPASLDLGAIDAGATGTGTLTVRDEGDAPLTLGALTLDDPQGAWIVTDLAGEELRPGDTRSIVVSCTPTGSGPADATLHILSDDPTTPDAAVALTARLREPDLALDPTSVDLGSLDFGDSATAVVTVTNNGDADLHVSGWSFAPSDPGLSLLFAGAFDTGAGTLLPHATTTLTFSWAPTSYGCAEGTLLLASDDPDSPELALPVTACGPGDAGDHRVELELTGDDGWEAWIDGDPFTAANYGTWSSADHLEWPLGPGEHVLAVHGYDYYGGLAGFQAALWVDGELRTATGDGTWRQVSAAPDADWLDATYDDSAWSPEIVCADPSGWGNPDLDDLPAAGAKWVWWTSDCAALGSAWLRYRFTLP